MSEHVRYVAARRPSPENPEQWSLYLPEERRWIDVVFRSKREADRLIDEMRQGPACVADTVAAPARTNLISINRLS